MAMTAPAPVEALARTTERAFPHLRRLVSFAADIGIFLPPTLSAKAGRLRFAEHFLDGSEGEILRRFDHLFRRRSLFASDWLEIAQSVTAQRIQLSDFGSGLATGMDNLLDKVSSRAARVLVSPVDAYLLDDLCRLRSWMNNNPLTGSPNDQLRQFRGHLQRLQSLLLEGIVQAHSPGDFRGSDRVFAERPSYYCSYSRTEIWLDERPGPVGRADLAEMSANLSRLHAPVYRMLWVTPEERRSGAAHRAAFFIWVVALEAACNDKAIADVRWRPVDAGNPEPRPFAILRDDRGQRRLGARRGLMTTGAERGRSYPHLASAFQAAHPIEDLLREDLWRQAA